MRPFIQYSQMTGERWALKLRFQPPVNREGAKSHPEQATKSICDNLPEDVYTQHLSIRLCKPRRHNPHHCPAQDICDR